MHLSASSLTYKLACAVRNPCLGLVCPLWTGASYLNYQEPLSGQSDLAIPQKRTSPQIVLGSVKLRVKASQDTHSGLKTCSPVDLERTAFWCFILLNLDIAGMPCHILL